MQNPINLSLQVYARSLGYKILQIFEGLIYCQKDNFLQNYFQFLAKCKIIHKKLPSENPDEIKKYVERINKKMNFAGKNLISVEELEPNEINKYHVKNFMNQGKF